MLINLNKLSLVSLRRSCLWFALVTMSLAAQVSFINHEIEHCSHTDASMSVEDCFACLFSSIEFDAFSHGAISKTFNPDIIYRVFNFLSIIDFPTSLIQSQPRAPPDISNA